MTYQTASLAAVACGLLIATSANAQWVKFSNQTSTRLLTPAPSSPAVGATDPDEKDYAYADVDRDGDIDLVVVRKQPTSTTGRRRNVLFMNEGVKEGHAINGVLVDRTSTLIPGFLDLTNDRDVVTVDVDGDGWLDIVTATTLSGDQPKSISHPRVYINRGNDAEGNWLGFVFDDVDRIPTFPVEPRFNSVSAGDIDGDGDMDLYFVDCDNGPYARPADLNDRLLINDGNGYFTDSLETHMTFQMLNSAFGTASAIADMNGDGYLDIVKSTTLIAPQRISISYNNPRNQGFFNQFQVVQPTGAPAHVSVGDLNNDGRLDLIKSDDGFDHYYLNQGNDANGQAIWSSHPFSFNGTGSFDDGFAGNNYAVDLDNDGWNDVLIADFDVDIAGCNRRMHIYRNLGDAPNVTLQEQVVDGEVVGGIPAAMLRGTFDVAVFDINGDGWNDLVIGRCTGTQVWINVPCRADLNGDGNVGPADLGILLGAWGAPGCGASPCPADLNNDGSVGPADLGMLLGSWGPC